MISLPKPIGDRPLSLASHLRRVANLVSSDSISYDWLELESCNCGLLARSLTGYSKAQLKTDVLRTTKRRPGGGTGSGTWTSRAKMANDACAFNPDVKLPEILAKLKEAGLEMTDYAHLEYLSHPALRSALSWTFRHYRRESAFASYCVRWAESIESYRAAHDLALSLPPVPPIQHMPLTEKDMEHIETRELVS